jgi:tRNA(adenine34) deaminase
LTDQITKSDEALMRRCIALARIARQRGDAPVGALIARDGQVIAEASERVDSALDVTGHGELVAVNRACQTLGTLDLSGCVLYTSAEPCLMCSYAIRQTGIGRVVFGAEVPAVGGVTSRYPILVATDIPGWPAPPAISDGVLQDECAALFAPE